MKNIVKYLLLSMVIACSGCLIITISVWFFFDRLYGDPEKLVWCLGNVLYTVIYLICFAIFVIKYFKKIDNEK